jgi:hypothetical protein
VKLTLEPTDKIQNVDGIPCRIWKGIDDAGTPLLAWVRFVQPQTHDPARLKAFEQKLQELPTPAPDREQPIDLRLVI